MLLPISTVYLPAEVQYDHVTGNRFSHGTRLLRWRRVKALKSCLSDQVKPAHDA
jgi:ATP-dependent DNA ligase